MAKAKKEKEVQKSYFIGVDVDQERHDNGDGDESGERYSYRGTTTSNWYINGLKLVEGDTYRSVEVPFKPVKGKIYHLLYAVYSTGDSFGQDNGACFEIVGIYKDRKVAEENEKRLRPAAKAGQTWDEKFNAISLLTEGLGKHKYSRPWVGYFERLDSLQVQSFILN